MYTHFLLQIIIGLKRTDTKLQYNVKLRTTTNLPLQIELYENENYSDSGSQDILSVEDTRADEYGTYFTTYTTPTSYFGFQNNEKNIYSLVVYFPSIYNSIDYQDVIENIEVIVESKQVV